MTYVFLCERMFLGQTHFAGDEQGNGALDFLLEPVSR